MNMNIRSVCVHVCVRACVCVCACVSVCAWFPGSFNVVILSPTSGTKRRMAWTMDGILYLRRRELYFNPRVIFLVENLKLE